MNFNREELALIQTALSRQLSQEMTQNYGQSGERVKDLRNRIQTHLLSDADPITVRSPVSEITA